MPERPTLIAIDHDDHHASHIGRTADGRQFLLTTPFVSRREGPGGREGAEFVALFLFNAAGGLVEARIDSFGPRATMDKAARDACCERRFAELGEVSLERIEVAPFSVTRFGVEFGLIAVEPETDEDDWTVHLEPGDYMAFFPPWDSGIYDT